jgi:zinc/manganese transport system substrate-binding protein
MRLLAAGLTSGFLFLSAASSADAALKVFACVPEWAALAEVIGGERLEIMRGTSALDDPEKATPTPEIVSALEGADLIVCTGAGLEKDWLPAAIEQAGNPKIAEGQPGHFLAAESVEIEQDAAEIAAHAEGGNEAHGATHVDGNPHIQGDPRNIQRAAGQLAKRLIAIDPDGKDFYTERIKAFVPEMKARMTELEKKAAPLRGARVAVQHEGSLYLLNWLGIETAMTIEGPGGAAAGPARISKLLKSIPQAQMKMVIYGAYEDPASAKQIAEAAGVPLVKLPYTIGGTEEATDIFTFYEGTIDRLLDGLSGRERS